MRRLPWNGPSLRNLVKTEHTMRLLPAILAMAAIVVASNILVQFLAGPWLTWGAFTYPFAFLVTDLTNRLYGVTAARKVVLAGFAVGLVCSLIGTQINGEFGPLVTLRVALGSATAFLVAQLMDVTVFDWFRRKAWWQAPLFSTLIGASLDTALFCSIAFCAALTFLEPGNDTSWATASIPLLGLGPEAPLWVSLAVADWGVKLLLAIVALVPFRVLVGKLTARIA
jgi:queuosine precursor transporter